MDTIATDFGLDDASAHTSNRKSARSGRVEKLVRADRRRSWTPEQKCQIVSESLEPGVTPSEVARRHGIGTGQLYTWRRQIVGVQSAVSTQSGPRFAPVEMSPAPTPPDQIAGSNDVGCAVVFPNGRPDRDRASLRRIVARGCACRWPRTAPSPYPSAKGRLVPVRS